MSVTDRDLLLLDTSVVVDVARNNRTGQAILRDYALQNRPDRPLISVVTAGELLGIAKAQAWTGEKTEQLNLLLREFVRVGLTSEVVEAYSDLVARCRHHNHTMGQQNDMWIAATTRAAGAILLTGDCDFDWLNTQYIRVEYVSRR